MKRKKTTHERTRPPVENTLPVGWEKKFRTIGLVIVQGRKRIERKWTGEEYDLGLQVVEAAKVKFGPDNVFPVYLSVGAGPPEGADFQPQPGAWWCPYEYAVRPFVFNAEKGRWECKICRAPESLFWVRVSNHLDDPAVRRRLGMSSL